MSPNERPPKGTDLVDVVERLENAEQFDLSALGVGEKLEFVTRHTTYLLERRGDGLYMSGHAKLCPEPTKVYIGGSTLGGSSIKQGFVVVGGKLEFTLPKRSKQATSWIQSFRRLN